jgi:hypothetical protein
MRYPEGSCECGCAAMPCIPCLALSTTLLLIIQHLSHLTYTLWFPHNPMPSQSVKPLRTPIRLAFPDGNELISLIDPVTNLDLCGKVNQLGPGGANNSIYQHWDTVGCKAQVVRQTKEEVCGEPTALKDMQNHVGGHILCTFCESEATDEGTLQSVGDDPCGFCGLDGCLTQLLEKKGGGITITSNCLYHYVQMQYGAAAKYTRSSPCTNVPIHCPICPTSVSKALQTI